MRFNSRRSEVYAMNGMVAASQPLAAQIGLRILQAGGNAADAAVATAAALNVTEPTSTGIGGDCFALFFDGKTKKVSGINGSGRAPDGLNIGKLNEIGIVDKIPFTGVHSITVPGAAAGWIDTIDRHGTMALKDILQPAIDLAENGFPVAPITARSWKIGETRLKSGPNANEMLLNGEAPKINQVMRNPTLAITFKELIQHGKAGFYEGRIAESIVDLITSMGGFMELDDLKKHTSTFDTPITTNYKGVDVYEIPPSGQGITALIGLNILEEFNLSEFNPFSSEYLHILIEAMRLAFADANWYVADPAMTNVPIKELLSKDYATKRRSLIDLSKASIDVQKGSPTASSDTVYFSVVDGDGNACSFINSNYAGFGTGLIPKGCGFTLQNRGAGFSLNPNHPNSLQPGKRPYHTIIPGMAIKDSELFASFGVMGGYMQPQGHVQVMLNMIDHGMNTQEALDHPRFCILDGNHNGSIAIEDGYSFETISKLSQMRHVITPVSGFGRGVFGRGQIIKRNPENGILEGGSDPRADGLVAAW
ncbi:MAG: gamma-glutamyltransferase [Candidatus Heimdallarchaeota archaeon]|nr:gamma-glutamyltransferase [Candidatus Heimdallarchaeota archaeon]MDH5644798.1 gamma-glutamyltransferase [Candidatus Heimdallarchaeota archaeon]